MLVCRLQETLTLSLTQGGSTLSSAFIVNTAYGYSQCHSFYLLILTYLEGLHTHTATASEDLQHLPQMTHLILDLYYSDMLYDEY